MPQNVNLSNDDEDVVPDPPPLHWTPSYGTDFEGYDSSRPRRDRVLDGAHIDWESYDESVVCDCDDEYECECSHHYVVTRWSDPFSQSVQNRLIEAAGANYTTAPRNWPHPEDLAGQIGLVSANAAVFSLLVGIEAELANSEASLGRARYVEDRSFYERLIQTLQAAREHYQQYSQCPCAACYEEPELPPCHCNEPHCDSCFPDGPPDWCECETCRPPQVDDDDYPDDFTGRPEVVAPEGRARFGIEIEFNRRNRNSSSDRMRASIINSMQRAGISVVDLGYTHEVTRCWKMTTDSTVTGGEIVSPIMSGSDESIEEVREVLRLVKDAGGVTGNRVGMHVHLDVSRFRTSQLKALAENMKRAERMLAAYVPEHRYNNTNGCGANLYRGDEWERIMTWVENVDPAQHCRTRENRVSSCPVDRYRSINFNSLLNYGTVEVRLLGHTLNTVKVRTWIRALQTIIDASSRRALIRGDGLEWLVDHGLEQEHADRFREIALSRGTEAWLLVDAA